MNNILNSHIISKLLNALPILLAIFVIVLISIIFTRIIINLILMMLIRKYHKIGNKIKSKIRKSNKKNKIFNKNDDELLRYRYDNLPDDLFPKAHSQIKAEIKANKISNTFEVIENEQDRILRQQQNKPQIVDFVKPVGFWTSMILGQKLTYLIQSAQILNKRGDKGFWASMIEAKERAQGRQHSRGR